MKKIVMLVILTIIFSGCSSKLENEIVERDKRIEELNQTILNLESISKELEQQNIILINDIDLIKKELNDRDNGYINLNNKLDEKDEEIITLKEQKEKNYERYFNLFLYITSLNQFEYVELIRNYEDLNDIELVNSFSNIYDINNIKVGDKINGFKIADIEVSKYSDLIGEQEAIRLGKLNENFVSIEFEGYFVLTGKLSLDYNGMYSMMVDSNELVYNMPISNITHEYCLNSSSYQMFDIINEELLIEELGTDISKELSENEDARYDIVGVFMEYSYNTPIHEATSHSVKLVDLLSIEKSIEN